jgi:RecB family exonuclease
MDDNAERTQGEPTRIAAASAAKRTSASEGTFVEVAVRRWRSARLRQEIMAADQGNVVVDGCLGGGADRITTSQITSSTAS